MSKVKKSIGLTVQEEVLILLTIIIVVFALYKAYQARNYMGKLNQQGSAQQITAPKSPA
jgi:hypothetical protein